MTFGKLHAAMLIGLLLAAPVAAQAGELKLMVPDLKPANGPVVVWLYNDAIGWKGGAAPFRSAAPPILDGRATATFEAPEGRYAAVAFQDRNGNGKLDVLPFGWPTEPVGFSGVANRPWFGWPDWDRSDFQVQEGQYTTVFVRLK